MAPFHVLFYYKFRFDRASLHEETAPVAENFGLDQDDVDKGGWGELHGGGMGHCNH